MDDTVVGRQMVYRCVTQRKAPDDSAPQSSITASGADDGLTRLSSQRRRAPISHRRSWRYPGHQPPTAARIVVTLPLGGMTQLGREAVTPGFLRRPVTPFHSCMGTVGDCPFWPRHAQSPGLCRWAPTPRMPWPTRTEEFEMPVTPLYRSQRPRAAGWAAARHRVVLAALGGASALVLVGATLGYGWGGAPPAAGIAFGAGGSPYSLIPNLMSTRPDSAIGAASAPTLVPAPGRPGSAVAAAPRASEADANARAPDGASPAGAVQVAGVRAGPSRPGTEPAPSSAAPPAAAVATGRPARAATTRAAPDESRPRTAESETAGAVAAAPPATPAEAIGQGAPVPVPALDQAGASQPTVGSGSQDASPDALTPTVTVAPVAQSSSVDPATGAPGDNTLATGTNASSPTAVPIRRNANLLAPTLPSPAPAAPVQPSPVPPAPTPSPAARPAPPESAPVLPATAQPAPIQASPTQGVPAQPTPPQPTPAATAPATPQPTQNASTPTSAPTPRPQPTSAAPTPGLDPKPTRIPAHSPDDHDEESHGGR
ncbi:MAG: hypothetical protein QOF51_560 [Chloroflexota bacterium]|nr:hypothetical protein [Chloroflexota bacterium]